MHRIKRSIVRARAKWVEEGEKPTRYFFNLENRNYVSKIIPRLQKDNGEIITEQVTVLEEVSSFYKHLYSSSDNTHIQHLNLSEYLKNYDIPKLSKLESDHLEGEITYKEAGNTLKLMKNNKSPGSDGFTTEFFKCFWGKLGNFVVRSLNFGYQTGQLSITQRLGIITCIPKADKPRHFIKNWRPISFLNNVYKITSGTIAIRIKTVLHKLINNYQTGFLSGRYI